jgi:hypothetical protein
MLGSPVMPRKSDGNLPKLVVLSPRERPEPPAKLTSEERKIWDRLCASAPGGYFDEAAGSILIQAVTLISDGERLKALRAEYIAQGNVEAELALGKTIRDNAKGIVAIMASLRLTPRSRERARTVGRGFARALTGRRPWDRSGAIEKRGPDEDGDGQDSETSA